MFFGTESRDLFVANEKIDTTLWISEIMAFLDEQLIHSTYYFM